MRSRDFKLEIKCSSRQAMIKKWLCMLEVWYLLSLRMPGLDTRLQQIMEAQESSLQLEIKV